MKLFVVLAPLVLAGCATQQATVWVKDGSTQDEFARDRGQCIQSTYSVPLASTFQQMAVFSGCMQGKGWQEVSR